MNSWRLCASSLAYVVLGTPIARVTPIDARQVSDGHGRRILLTHAQRPITLRDIVESRQLREVRLSPDGKRVAFVLRAPSLRNNASGDQLFVVSARLPTGPRKLIDEASISDIRWSADGRSISYLSSRTGSVQLWSVSLRGGRARLALDLPPKATYHGFDSYEPFGRGSKPSGLLMYEWSPTGRLLAYTTTRRLSMHELNARNERGVVYDDATMSFADLVTGTWIRMPTQLRVFDTISRKDQLLTELSDDISAIAWSPDESRLALSYGAPPVQNESMVFFNHDIAIVTLTDGHFAPVATSEADEVLPAWAPNAQSLAFVALLDNWNSSLKVLDLRRGSVVTVAFGAIGYQVNQLGWGKTPGSLVYEAPDSGTVRRGKSTLYEVQIATGAISQLALSKGHLSGCSLDRHASTAACILQSLSDPPNPAIVDLESGAVHALADLHPEFREIELGAVSELHWENSYGQETNGFLVKPVGYVQGRRYPTLIMLYGFEGKFVTDAEWISSYPVQAFARDGFAVLLMNYPRIRPWEGPNFRRGSEAWGRGPLASIERGVELLVDLGISDSTRLGILGWSYGCFLTEFAITQTNLFRAASVGNGGDYNPGLYWLQGRRTIRANYEHVMGGPPYGETLANWLAFSPAFNAHRAQSPILMEFNPLEGLAGLEMLAAFRRNDVPVEFVVYPGEGHILVQPKHRYHSMERNLDWFNFWLRDREDDGPSKQDQYARWRAMRANVASTRHPHSSQ
jgi:dipeptidyl aminopeptidase/acylaminoacyl peptidase